MQQGICKTRLEISIGNTYAKKGAMPSSNGTAPFYLLKFLLSDFVDAFATLHFNFLPICHKSERLIGGCFHTM